MSYSIEWLILNKATLSRAEAPILCSSPQAALTATTLAALDRKASLSAKGKRKSLISKRRKNR